MTKRTLLVAALLCVCPDLAQADGRLNFRIDFNQADIRGATNAVGIDWPGLEVELEKSFKTPKIIVSGVALGVRRETFYGFTGFGEEKGVHRWDEGTYLTLRVYRNIHFGGDTSWSISPSVAVLYGIPGTTLNRTTSTRRDDGGVDFTQIFPMRNANVPKTLAEPADIGTDSAMLYPEVSVSIKRPLLKGGLTFEWVAGMRILRFGVIDSTAQGAVFEERRTLAPTLGVRLGIRIF